MTYEQERRAIGPRVPVQALVEICGRDVGGAPAFEAETLDVSGRGMHVRTAYLPDVGAPLVCRFESGGQEIVVEGAVAWRDEQERGGEFGIKFTALDSGSVEALKLLCGTGGPEIRGSESDSRGGEMSTADPGARVRLHIEGLGSPMKASIRAGGSKQLQVASNLEFLKVGRHLEVEDLNAGERRGAQIDGVNVVIDPQTRVPQLVVALRYEGGQESTPEPSVIDSEGAVPRQAAAAAPAFAMEAEASTEDDGTLEDADIVGDDLEGEAEAMRGKVATVAVGAGVAVKKGGALVARYGGRAAVGLGTLFKGAGAKVLAMRNKSKVGEAPRRTTAPPPPGALSGVGQRLRPQSAARDGSDQAVPPETPAPSKRRAKKIAAASALGVLLLTVGVLAIRKPAAPPGATDDKAPPASISVAAKGAAGDVKQVDEQGNPIAPGAPGAAPAQGGGDKGAEVPLFGPTPMATMEPAPLGPTPAGDEAAAEDGKGAAKADAEDPPTEEESEKAAANAVEDEAFPDGEHKKGKPGDVAPWGRGKMNTPTVHRLRLDHAGSAIQGAVNATGFTVLLPGVKVMESPKGIMDRDARIARVKTRNGSSGAEISFQFKDGIPAYRVRLKKDYVEFLISSGKSATDVPSSTKGAKKAGKKKAAAAATPKAEKKSTKKPAKKGGKAKKAAKGDKKKAG